MEILKITRKFAIGVMAFTMMIALVFPVFADWNEVDYSGDWYVRERNHWVAEPDMNSGESYWEYNNFVFEGYEASINFTQFKSYRHWWEYQDNKKVVLLWNFSNIYIYINFLEQHNLFGWIQDRWVQVATSENSTAFTTSADFWWNPFAIQTQRDDFFNYPTYVKIYMDKVSATEVQIIIMNCRTDTSHFVLMWNNTYTVSADWFAHNNLTFSIMHDNYGLFDGGMSDIIHTTPFSPDYEVTEGVKGFGIWDFIDNLIGGAIRSLPNWLQEQIFTLGSWFNRFVDMLPTIWNFVLEIIPILPYILLFWVLDAVFTSIHEGNIKPLGICFSTIINTGASVINGLVSILHTIYDFIHIW